MDTFSKRLTDTVKIKKTPVMVGLDPRFSAIPEVFRRGISPEDLPRIARAYHRFSFAILDIVAPLVACVKPQIAFFEELGPWGMVVLSDIIRYAHELGLIVILDGKRNDIGSTAAGYAAAYLGKGSAWEADSLTVSPYLGEDSLIPFINVAEKRGSGIFVLVKTSNPGGGMLQDMKEGEVSVYQKTADLVEQKSAEFALSRGEKYGAVGAVVGATYPQQLEELRQRMPHAWLLVPGFGAQGGTAKDISAAFDDDGLGAVINSSRAIIFAYDRKDYAGRFAADKWELAVETATREMIAQLQAETKAGRL
ncbi:MAG: orotidine-5'-phosphate decarboxylase [Planctomycetia bacterium]|nr:orotidine-5'-phosphate decarboxylase [Planctomycetia bacterium]